jgi:hypothetical protein
VTDFYVSKSGKANPISFLGLLGTVLFLVVIVAISDLVRTPGADARSTTA